MHVEFIPCDTPSADGPSRQFCDAELVFDEGDGVLAGLRLVGFTLWRRQTDGGLSVMFPSRLIGFGNERSSFSYLRGEPESEARLRRWVVEEHARRYDQGVEVTTSRSKLTVRFVQLRRAKERVQAHAASIRAVLRTVTPWTCAACGKSQAQDNPRCRHCGTPARPRA